MEAYTALLISEPKNNIRRKNGTDKTVFSSVLSAGFLCAGLILGVNTYATGTGPCTEDISKFCQNAKPGSGKIVKCLNVHEKDLSSPCSDSLKSIESTRE